MSVATPVWPFIADALRLKLLTPPTDSTNKPKHTRRILQGQLLQAPGRCARYPPLDTDTYNEIDDQFALVQMVLSPQRIRLEAIYAAPFLNERSSSPGDRHGAELHTENPAPPRTSRCLACGARPSRGHRLIARPVGLRRHRPPRAAGEQQSGQHEPDGNAAPGRPHFANQNALRSGGTTDCVTF